ncbi:MAG: ISAs1 family transposase [Clostridiales bacterium]|jgi:predicted transposase YbfD/YdcC|nr:ISAs1 family transposase [Clostridiales bacterium]
MLMVKGCIVTIDAMGTQVKIAERIVERGADYILAVKENQETLYKDVKDYFDACDVTLDYARTSGKGHGRVETRECRISNDIGWLDQEKRWKSLAGIAEITTRTESILTQ